MRALRVTGNVFIVLGATFLFFVVYELIGTAQITKGHQTALANQFEEAFRPPDPKPTYSPPEWPKLDNGDVVARIKIPKIDVNMIVVEGVTLGDLAQGPGHYPETPLPGEYRPSLAVGIAGHRTGWGSPFIDLDRLRRGDEIIIETPRFGTFRYRVTRSEVVKPGKVSVLQGDQRSEVPYKLVLTTCTPKYTSLNRLIVYADQVSPAPAVPPGAA